MSEATCLRDSRIASARSDKANKLIGGLRRMLAAVADCPVADLDPALVAQAAHDLDADQWATLARLRGVRPPSPDTLTVVLDRLDTYKERACA